MSAHPIRLVVVEDSLTARSLLVHALNAAADMTVIGEAVNGQEAVQLVQTLQPDLVVMDVVMPDMDGLTATRQIMARCPTPILIFTAYAEAQEMNIVFEAMKAGALDVVAKPSRQQAEVGEWADELQVKIRSVLNASPQIGRS